MDIRFLKALVLSTLLALSSKGYSQLHQLYRTDTIGFSELQYIVQNYPTEPSAEEIEQFDMRNFAAENAPHLLEINPMTGTPYIDGLAYWAATMDISPRLLLALAETTSGAVKSKNKAILERPMGVLSRKDGFTRQVKDIAYKLNQIRSGALRNSQKSANATKDPLFQGAPLMLLDEGLESSFHRLFQENLSLSATNKLDNAEQKTTTTTAATNYINIQELPANTLRLPYPGGESWIISGGAHKYSGSGSRPFSSIDFAKKNHVVFDDDTSDHIVTAMTAGTVQRIASCLIRVVNSDLGVLVDYLHMEKSHTHLVSHGQTIAQNTPLGPYASSARQLRCEDDPNVIAHGSSPHVHVRIRKRVNGVYRDIDISGDYMSGYLYQSSNHSHAYSRDCNHNWFLKNGIQQCHFGYIRHPDRPEDPYNYWLAIPLYNPTAPTSNPSPISGPTTPNLRGSGVKALPAIINLLLE